MGAPQLSSGASPVENGASFIPGQGAAPGSFISVFGSNFAAALTLANFNSMPLATSLAGVTVSFNGVYAPIVGVTANQINAQVPWSVLPNGASSWQAQVVVTNGAGSPGPAMASIAPAAPGLFQVFRDSTGISRPPTEACLGLQTSHSLDINPVWPSPTRSSFGLRQDWVRLRISQPMVRLGWRNPCTARR